MVFIDPCTIITQYYLLTAITSLLLRVCCEIHHLNFIIAITSIVLWLLCHIDQPVAFGIINSILINIFVVSFTCASLTSWIVSRFECGVLFISWTSLSLSPLSWWECADIVISRPSLLLYYHFFLVLSYSLIELHCRYHFCLYRQTNRQSDNGDKNTHSVRVAEGKNEHNLFPGTHHIFTFSTVA